MRCLAGSSNQRDVVVLSYTDSRSFAREPLEIETWRVVCESVCGSWPKRRPCSIPIGEKPIVRIRDGKEAERCQRLTGRCSTHMYVESKRHCFKTLRPKLGPRIENNVSKHRLGLGLHTRRPNRCPPPPTVSDPDGGNGSDSDGSGSQEGDRDEEDVLAKQAREREQAAVDVTGVCLGALVGLLAKEIAREAMVSAAPSKVIEYRFPLCLAEAYCHWRTIWPSFLSARCVFEAHSTSRSLA